MYLVSRLRLVFLFTFISTFTFAQEKAHESKELPKAQVFESKQTVTIDGKVINLQAKAGTLELKDENNKPIALFGFTAYFKENGGKNRPIVFAYNGGPGSSSYWLHMGIMGPKRIVVDDPNYNQGAPYQLVNNEFSILDVADVVMMDPVGTGLSVPIGDATGKDFWGVDQDIRSVSLFIMQFLKAHDRLNSPKYILGESYGTFRNAGVMNYLLNKGYALNGVIMVSAVFDLRSLFFAPNEDLSYIVYLPTMAATAWYHNKIERKQSDLDAFVEEVRGFTENHYTPALFKGNRISDTEKNQVAASLESYTGVSADIWKRADLKITAGEFFQELLRDEKNTVGRLDSRYKGINIDPMSMDSFTDPQSDAISPAYTMGFLDYFHGALGVSKDLLYATSAYSKEGFKWDWKHQGNNFWGADAAVTTVPDMTEALSKDPNVKILIMNGYYDLATVFYGVEHSISHIDLPKSATDRIIMEYYEAGHMMYTHLPSAKKFREDLKTFIEDTLRK
ncbi:MAG TPA: carboxypeptidase [Algoriphagus sp.]|jgi:carboxypeptidase C (cathepsin A)|uniref:S10 family peptidase n=1 Tax=unclassified Algoriphagus TaxID=2641541 RepID=UPI000C63630F|nr:MULTISPECIES: carboxypeptidase [unclassified Algoriphagus]MAL12877.1 carboxypeptidase [Algoriphagus sp.]MAN85697.1 carboxypeptidase [Algoriphagus sp.]HAD50001.1 carboxypeptidase [Algoriphagus sp.]HAS58414.1 carboxypeptidase [Algoriphagus sp.]HAZ23829.1 carboxypeptidase [Algoriphagus sp.]|tara:strand:+ start:12154 stop:13671 length:1518 start_codon:yes stop_codon:yes gene_type:complete